MSLTIGAIESVVVIMFFTTLSGMISGVKRAEKGVSCCVVTYFYIAFFAVVAITAVGLAVLLEDGLLEVGSCHSTARGR